MRAPPNFKTAAPAGPRRMNYPRTRSALMAAVRAAVAGLALGGAAAGCCPPDRPETAPEHDSVPADRDLNARVAAALGGNAELAATYAAFYRLLAERLRAGADDSAGAFAAVAGRAADLLKLPGDLSGPAGDELGGVLNPPSRFTPARRDAAAAAFDRLADACERTFR